MNSQLHGGQLLRDSYILFLSSHSFPFSPGDRTVTLDHSNCSTICWGYLTVDVWFYRRYVRMNSWGETEIVADYIFYNKMSMSSIKVSARRGRQNVTSSLI